MDERRQLGLTTAGLVATLGLTNCGALISGYGVDQGNPALVEFGRGITVVEAQRAGRDEININLNRGYKDSSKFELSESRKEVLKIMGSDPYFWKLVDRYRAEVGEGNSGWFDKAEREYWRTLGQRKLAKEKLNKDD